MSQFFGAEYHFANVLGQRRWLCCARPFPHFIAHDVFAPHFYSELDAAFGEVLARGLSEGKESGRFSRNITNYDAYAVTFDNDMLPPFQVFISREWHDLLAQLAAIPATGEVSGGFHHHLPGSRSGEIHNDLNPGWFVDSVDMGQLNLSRSDVCDYNTGAAYQSGLQVHESIRALAVLFYLHNEPWREGDGGETGLYDSSRRSVLEPTKAVPPINNSLLAFECRPNSFHSFIGNRRTARNSMIMWLHRPKRDVMQRWGEKAIVGWGRPAIWGQR
jgi:2OG-Fe(II) oxygenase superfamily